MRNIKLTIEYDGTNYLGWQRQKGGSTIQETIETAIEKITKNGVKLIGSGRTDSGVHALGQVANFRTTSGLSAYQLQKALNAILPQDISIVKCEEADVTFHAQFDAKSKIYAYVILYRPYPSALERLRAWHIPFTLRLPEMTEASKAVIGKHDFSAFGLSTPTLRSSVREVLKLELSLKENDNLYFEIEATGFLKRMVRLVVGTLIQVGRERITVDGFRRILESRERTKYVRAAPPWGLYLKEVKY
ncbi:MAG: tRNA pseudouridine(38-40) synthase TruA [Thermodesulfobacteriota bacterium]